MIAAKLPGLFAGELDWIVMKALDKDRARRYETANGLAKDVQRYLTGEAVEACPPTLAYRFRKSYRKHRVSILIGGAFVALLFWDSWRLTGSQSRKPTLARKRNDPSVSETSVLIVFRDVLEEFNPHKRHLLETSVRKNPDNATIQEVLVRACQNLDNKTDITPVMRAKVRMEFASFFYRLHEYQLAYQQFDKAYREFEKELGRDDD